MTEINLKGDDMCYHIHKQTRLYNGFAYCGPSSENVPMVFSCFEDAVTVATMLQNRNPVGWNIYDAGTGELVAGYDFFTSEQ